MKLTLSPADGSDRDPIVLEITDNPRLEAQVVIGRSRDCDVQLEKQSVSRRHCAVLFDAAQQCLRICDFGSRNGTLVNGQPVEGPCELHDGDLLTVGTVPFTVGVAFGSSVWDRVATRYGIVETAMPRQLKFAAADRD